MDKYGVAVDVPDESAKSASSGAACPGCSSNKVNYRGTTPHCPNCGTKPWERPRGNTKSRR